MAVFFEPDSSLGLPSILPRVHAKGKISRQNTAERASLSLKARQKGSPRIPAGSAASPRNAGGGGVVSFAEESPSMIRSFAAGAKKSPRKPSQGANKAKASVNPSASAAERAPTVMFFGDNGGAGGSVAFRGASVFGGGPPSAGDFQRQFSPSGGIPGAGDFQRQFSPSGGDFQRQFSPSGGGHVQTAGLKDLGLGSQGVRAGGSKGTPMKPPAGRGRLGQGLPMLDSEAADSGAQAKAAASKMTKLALGANQGPSSFSRQTSAADRASKPKPVDKSDNIDLGPLAALPLGRQIHVDEAHVKSLVGEGEPEFIKGFHEVQELILSLFRAADTDGDTQITHSQLKAQELEKRLKRIEATCLQHDQLWEGALALFESDASGPSSKYDSATSEISRRIAALLSSEDQAADALVAEKRQQERSGCRCGGLEGLGNKSAGRLPGW
ncbi:unnamed protein product, partial [Polarella glacialis]